jgi:hypothetical protein
MSDKLQFVVVPAYVDKLKFVGHSNERHRCQAGNRARLWLLLVVGPSARQE